MQITERLGHGLIYFFTEIPLIGDAMAALLAVVLIGISIAISFQYRRKYYQPLAKAIEARVKLLSKIEKDADGSVDASRLAFAAHFNDIDAAMLKVENVEALPLRRTWEEYRETIVDPSADVLQNTARPEHFFINLGERHRGLNWFANIFIAIGLLITFLGIIAALSTLDFSGGVEAMQDRLNELMKVAGAKFWASVGGIIASIILRSFDYRLGKRINDGLSSLCDLLEHGMLYLPPQRIASQQLAQLQEQTPALRKFSEQLALSIDEALQRQMGPMITHLGSIQDGIDRIGGDGGKAVQDVITERAGAEMTALSSAIAEMSNSLSHMSDRMSAQTGEVDRQIQMAVERFGNSSDQMRLAFAELNTSFSAISSKLIEDQEHMSERSRQQLNEVMTSLEATLEEMKERISGAASEFGNSALDAANNSARVGQEAMEQSFNTFVQRFNEAGAPLVSSMRIAGDSISRSADGFSIAQAAIGHHANSISEIAGHSNQMVQSFRSVADDVSAATEPMRKSAEKIADAVKSVQTVIASNAQSSQNAHEQFRTLASSLESTSSAAAAAWMDYRTRFEQVDRSLAAATSALSDAAIAQAQNVTERVGQLDSALGDAVSRLAGALEPLEALSETVEELSLTLANETRGRR